MNNESIKLVNNTLEILKQLDNVIEWSTYEISYNQEHYTFIDRVKLMKQYREAKNSKDNIMILINQLNDKIVYKNQLKDKILYKNIGEKDANFC